MADSQRLGDWWRRWKRGWVVLFDVYISVLLFLVPVVGLSAVADWAQPESWVRTACWAAILVYLVATAPLLADMLTREAGRPATGRQTEGSPAGEGQAGR